MYDEIKYRSNTLERDRSCVCMSYNVLVRTGDDVLNKLREDFNFDKNAEIPPNILFGGIGNVFCDNIPTIIYGDNCDISNWRKYHPLFKFKNNKGEFVYNLQKGNVFKFKSSHKLTNTSAQEIYNADTNTVQSICDGISRLIKYSQNDTLVDIDLDALGISGFQFSTQLFDDVIGDVILDKLGDEVDSILPKNTVIHYIIDKKNSYVYMLPLTKTKSKVEIYGMLGLLALLNSDVDMMHGIERLSDSVDSFITSSTDYIHFQDAHDPCVHGAVIMEDGKLAALANTATLTSVTPLPENNTLKYGLIESDKFNASLYMGVLNHKKTLLVNYFTNLIKEYITCMKEWKPSDILFKDGDLIPATLREYIDNNIAPKIRNELSSGVISWDFNKYLNTHNIDGDILVNMDKSRKTMSEFIANKYIQENKSTLLEWLLPTICIDIYLGVNDAICYEIRSCDMYRKALNNFMNMLPSSGDVNDDILKYKHCGIYNVKYVI